MRAAVLHALGERPRYQELPDPQPGPGEEPVRITACPLTNLDRARAAGTHFAAPTELPAVLGSLAAGRLPDGSRVLFRSAHGVMADRATTRRDWCVPIPDAVDDVTAAAVQNPGVSAWISLTWRAALRPGESVLVLGATGVTGRLAVQLAKHFGAGRVVAAGRDPRGLAELRGLGADATVRLDVPDRDLDRALRGAAGPDGFDVVLDYLWGRPTEVYLNTLVVNDMVLRHSRTRLVQVGQMAGPSLTLPAEVLRSSGLEILGNGTGNAPPPEVLSGSLARVLDLVGAGELRIAAHPVPLAEVAEVWDLAASGRRTVLVP
ncbi:quinone oxidoreductase family protein [Kitasatospora phosalacinea]|uniref:quinone oxidoreductase family protein n=1 Tax=Kitasatospora phosalacinea TaxID=2065 RepID=UPI000526A7AC|nr:zinc-binding alcohol dehydrogenase family protein [Kitasatospora phosalacinea]